MYTSTDLRPTRAGVASLSLQRKFGSFQRVYEWVRRCSHRSVRLIERNRALDLRSTPAPESGPASSRNATTTQAPRCSTQRAGIAPPHAENDGLSGVTRDGEWFVFISVPAAFVGGVPVTRAMNPWAIPEASV
jgi:hypothetical protein